MLIVPEQFSHAAEKKLLERIDIIEDNKVEVFSFNRLCTTTEKRMGFAHTDKIDAIGKTLIVRDILKNNDFLFYRNAFEKDGFIDLISQTICEFKKYMILPETLLDISKKTDDKILSMKLNDLSVMYAEYEKIINNNYSDSDDSLTILANRLSESDIYENKYVFFDEFSTFIPQEYRVISELCNKCREVCITLTYDAKEPNSTLFMPTSDTISSLKKHIKQNIKFTALENTHFVSPELSFMEKQLYTFPEIKYMDKCENIKVYGMSTPFNEVEMCSYEITKLLRSGRYMFKDIGIICSDIEVYARHIERIFEQSNIEYFIDIKNDVINHHLVRFVLGLIEVYLYDYNFASVFNYLKAAFVNAQVSDIALLEKYIRRTNLKRSTWLNDDKWNLLLESNFSDDEISKSALNKIRTSYIIPLAKMHEQIKGRHKVITICKALYSLLVELKLPLTISDYIKHFNDIGELRYAKEYEKMWEILTDTLDKIVLLNGETTVNVQEFYDMLVTAFSQSKIGFIPSAIDRVMVGNTERTRFDGIKVLFVLGVNEGIFPVPSKPDGVLTDSDKDGMKLEDVEFSTTSSIAAFYSQFCAYTAFTMPSEMLVLSYAKSGNDFKAIHKSYIVDKITDLFSIKEYSENSFDLSEKIISLSSAKDRIAHILSKKNTLEASVPLAQGIYVYLRENSDFIDKINYFIQSDNIARNLSESNLNKLINILSYTSVSKLERYMACKYAYFIDYILKIENLKEEQVDALDIGNITHHVLEKLSCEYGKTRESFINSGDEEILHSIDEMINEELGLFLEKIDELSPREEYAIKRLKNSVFLCFKAIRNQFVNSEFEPLGYEIEFGEGSDLGPIAIKTPLGKEVLLTGKIDRADVFNSDGKAYVRVIDYKTGYKEFKLDDVLYGLSVQLMVYLNKLVSSDNNFSYGGALYFPVTKALLRADGRTDSIDAANALESEFKLKGIVPYDDVVLSAYDEKFASSLKHGASKNKRVTPHGFEVIDKYLTKKMGSICDDILSGDISVAPSKKGDYAPCDYCKYNSICRFDPCEKGNDFTHYKAINVYDEIIKEMEETISVDNEPESGN